MIKNVTAITASSYLSMLFLGVCATLVGAAARNIGLSPYQIGLLIAAQQVGFLLSAAISGALSDTYEKPRILFIGSLILGAALLVFYRTDLFAVNLFIIFLVGVGMGAYEGVTDAMLLDIHARRQSVHVNINHFFVTFGSIVITLYLIFLQMNWRRSVVQSGIVVLVLAGIFGLTHLRRRQAPSGGYLKRFQALARERVLMVLFIATALAVGVELGVIGILTTFLVELRGFSLVTSKVGLIVFLIGMAIGRLLLGFATQKGGIQQFIVALCGLSFVFFTGMFFVDLGSLTYLAVFLAGISLSALLPLMITRAGLLYPQGRGTVLGLIKVAAALGGILLPFCMSLVARSVSFQASLVLFPAVLLIALCVLLLPVSRYLPADQALQENL